MTPPLSRPPTDAESRQEEYERAVAGANEPRLNVRDGANGGEGAREQDARSQDEMAAAAVSDALDAALRKPAAGETRVRAVLTRIECGPKGLVFVFRAGERTLRLTSAGFGGLHIVAYTREAGAELSCGARKTESPAVVTFRGRADARSKTDGALVALEFVPANFQLKQ